MKNEDDLISFARLPDDFRLRVINLSSMFYFDMMTRACPEVKTLRYRRHEVCFQNFITDHNSVYTAATRDIIEALFSYCCRYLDDGPLTINPDWVSVLLVDDIVNKNELLGISDTLVLYLTKSESYDRVVPLLAGPYFRLVLYGNFTWAQVERLLHSKLKQVRIMGKVEVNPEDYDHVVKFVLSFPRDLDYKFSFHRKCFSSDFVKHLKTACNNHESHSIIKRYKYVHFISKKSQKSYYLRSLFLILILTFLFVVTPCLDEHVNGKEKSSIAFLAFVSFCFTDFLVIALVLKSLTNKGPRDVTVHQKVKDLL